MKKVLEEMRLRKEDAETSLVAMCDCIIYHAKRGRGDWAREWWHSLRGACMVYLDFVKEDESNSVQLAERLLKEDCEERGEDFLEIAYLMDTK